MTEAHMIVENRPTYRAPGINRRYLTAHSAYIAWAKKIIFSHCECDRLGERCDLHERMFRQIVSYDGEGCPIDDMGYEDNTYYLKVRNRLVRWLKWRDRRASNESY